jgi:hypothetical protein
VSAPWRRIELPNKRIKQTSLAAALGWQGEVPPRAPQGQIGGRTASQLIRGVGRTPWVRVIDRATDMTALLVIDMQVGLFTTETPRFDADGVVGRINALARAVHESDGIVIFIQHDGPAGDAFEPGTSGWQLLPSLERDPADELFTRPPVTPSMRPSSKLFSAGEERVGC